MLRWPHSSKAALPPHSRRPSRWVGWQQGLSGCSESCLPLKPAFAIDRACIGAGSMQCAAQQLAPCMKPTLLFAALLQCRTELGVLPADHPQRTDAVLRRCVPHCFPICAAMFLMVPVLLPLLPPSLLLAPPMRLLLSLLLCRQGVVALGGHRPASLPSRQHHRSTAIVACCLDLQGDCKRGEWGQRGSGAAAGGSAGGAAGAVPERCGRVHRNLCQCNLVNATCLPCVVYGCVLGVGAFCQRAA